jgi:glycosyltransferase involved in cell wall biosynthesis
MIKLSLIIPVYNRPDEVDELLQSLSLQTNKDFEVLIIEDGSSEKCNHIIDKYQHQINIKYYFKQNTGPGTTRNFGVEKASGNYYIFFDSDCIIPESYIENCYKNLNENYVDAFGGPDAAHKSFTDIQKAINYSMTSFFTTGGIRGGKKKLDKFHPRSFNMGISAEVFKKTGGFSKMRFGEDVDLSLRIIKEGFKTALFPDCFVYHKRRTDFKKFYKQVYNSGIARINLHLLHPGSLKLVHFMPSVFVIFSIFMFFSAALISSKFIYPLFLYSILVYVDSLIQNKSLKVAFLSIPSSFVQIFGYGFGFIESFYKRLILKKSMFQAYEKNFYD